MGTVAAVTGNKKIVDLPPQGSPPASWLVFTGDPIDGTLYKTERQQLGFIETIRMGQPGGVASLDPQGKILPGQIPSLAISETSVVDSEAEMLALLAQTGDVAVRTDTGQTYILQNMPATELTNWVELTVPGQIVVGAGDGLSFDSQAGLFRLGRHADDTTSAEGIVYDDTVVIVDPLKTLSFEGVNKSARLYLKPAELVSDVPVVGMSVANIDGIFNKQAVLEMTVDPTKGGTYSLTVQYGVQPYYTQRMENSTGIVTTYARQMIYNDSTSNSYIQFQRSGTAYMSFQAGGLHIGTPNSAYPAQFSIRYSATLTNYVAFVNDLGQSIHVFTPTEVSYSNLIMKFSGSTVQASGNNNFFLLRTMFGHSTPNNQAATLVQIGPESHSTNSIATIATLNNSITQNVTCNLYVDRRLILADTQTVANVVGMNCATYILPDATATVGDNSESGILAAYFTGGFLNKSGITNTTVQCGTLPQRSTTVICVKGTSMNNTQTLNGWMSGIRSVFNRANTTTGTLTNYADLVVGCTDGTGNITNRYGLFIIDMTGSATNYYGVYQAGAGTKNYFAGQFSINNDTKIYSIGTTATATNAILELASTTKGFLLPRMSEVAKNALVGPTAGLVIYQTDATAGIYYHNGTAWVKI